MTNSKVINLLRTFTKSEFKEFGLFINSGYNNGEKVLSNFYNQLKKYYPDFAGAGLNKKKLYSKLFPGKAYNDSLFRNTISDLLKLAEDFLKIRHFEKEKFYGQYLLLKELTNRKQNSLFKMNFKKADRMLNSDAVRDEIYYQNKFLLEDEWRRNHVVNSSKMLFETDNLKEQSELLHIYFITEFIKLYAILLNQSRYTFDYKFHFDLFDAVTEYLTNNFSLYKGIPYINIFYNCVMLYKTFEMKYFRELKLLLKKHYRILTPTDRKNIFIVLLKYCDEQIAKGDYPFLEEKFSVNEGLLKTKAYFEGNDFMAHYIYESIALTAIDSGRLEWTESFLNRYKKLVHSDFKNNSYNICMAELLFGKEKYSDALVSLSLVIPADVKLKIKINILLLKIFFCRNETGPFNSLLESSRKFIVRNKTIQEINKIQFRNFLTCISKLYKIKNDDNFLHELRPLRIKIQKSNQLISKKWLSDIALNDKHFGSK